MKRTLIIMMISTLLSSCSQKIQSIDERLQSGKPELIRSALTDARRTGNSDSMAAIAMLLNNNDFKSEAALTLSTLKSDTADTVVLGGMAPQAENDGRLYYFYLVNKERLLRKDAGNFIKANADKFTPNSQVLAYMIMGKPKEAVDAYIKADFGQNITLKREFVIFLGEQKYAPAYGLLADMAAKEPALKAHATYARNSIKNPGKITCDKKDRVITKNDYWEKDAYPAFPTKPGTYKAWHTANPDILVHNKNVYLYYRSGDGTDRITLATAPLDFFNGRNFDDYSGNPIIDAGPYIFDEKGVLDPATVYFKDKVYLYYSAIGNGPDRVGLAVSDNFYNFKKKQKAILVGRAPEVVEKDGIIYLYYVAGNPEGGYSVFLATSTDGVIFEGYGNSPILSPSDDPSAWDAKTVTVPRIIENNGVYYMLYAGDNKYLDYPPYFGIAFSTDLIHWTRGSQNPVFSRGVRGSFDDGGIWYGQLYDLNGKWFMWYEGWGGGDSHDKEYGPGGHSQIGLATGVFNIEELL
ncbi:MAG: hypothetical protein LLG37_05905 [Spirochaetia bacterium]|nr:hypothetical protein [Spirochaetia bacterium]